MDCPSEAQPCPMRYQHLSPGHLRDAMRALDGALSAAESTALAAPASPVQQRWARSPRGAISAPADKQRRGRMATPRRKWWTILDLNQ